MTRTKSSGKSPARPKARKARTAAVDAPEGPKQTATRGRRSAARAKQVDDEPARPALEGEVPGTGADDGAEVPFVYVPPVMAPNPAGQLPRRRAVFFDVENTSRTEDIEKVLAHLALDFTRGGIEFMAVGNWRVIGHEPARILAARGARLIHSAPATGVRDWSDLRIAVAAGAWIAVAQPGDILEIVSDDQAFEAVGDEAASRGIVFRRVSYRRLAGLPMALPTPGAAYGHVAEPQRGSRGGRRSRRRGGGGRGSYGASHAAPHHAPSHRSHAAPRPVAAAPAPEPAADESVQTAPLDELLDVLHALLARAQQGITLDMLANALKARGFRRRPGSPRLITRLKLIKDIVIDRAGNIRFADGVTGITGPVRIHGDTPLDDLDDDTIGEDDGLEASDDDLAADEPAGDDAAADDAAAEPAAADGTPQNGRRRRRRRGGRRRRGRRGGGGGTGGSVEAAAAPS